MRTAPSLSGMHVFEWHCWSVSFSGTAGPCPLVALLVRVLRCQCWSVSLVQVLARVLECQ